MKKIKLIHVLLFITFVILVSSVCSLWAQNSIIATGSLSVEARKALCTDPELEKITVTYHYKTTTEYQDHYCISY